jgi:hypothetical protein
MITDAFPFLAPTAATVELTARLRQLADDLDRIRMGGTPSKTELAVAPLITEWKVALTPMGISLIGFASGHPALGSRRIVTSPLWVVDPDLRWARSMSRFYRLGERAFPAPANLH